MPPALIAQRAITKNRPETGCLHNIDSACTIVLLRISSLDDCAVFVYRANRTTTLTNLSVGLSPAHRVMNGVLVPIVSSSWDGDMIKSISAHPIGT
jgi:hypothetical protein